MSELKFNASMLDNFDIGAPISDHNGVRCCPAMERDTEEKYIVKVISIPASRQQLDALLLSGACADEDAAQAYFRSLAQDVTEEAEILQKLSGVEGFVPYRQWQVVERPNSAGVDVFLLGTYKRSLERYLRRNALTQLGALNLGLDLCAALAACRRFGYLYVDLKPENVFLTKEQEYRLGDLGFIRLGSLQYASLPDKYRSCYTPPEIADAFSTLNTTLDTYAVGLILYQAFNDGKLPEKDPESDTFPAPAYADNEMAQIILKAIAPRPEDRWQDPVYLGQALVSYIQRNGANDVPIIPVQDPDAPAPSEAEAYESEETNTPGLFSPEAKDLSAAEAPHDSNDPAEAELEPSNDDAGDLADEEADEEFENLSFLDLLSQEDAVLWEGEEISYDTLSEDVSNMLNQADSLAAVQVPEPVVAPEPVEIPLPEPIVAQDPPIEPAPEISTEALPAEESKEDSPSGEPQAQQYDDEAQAHTRKKASAKSKQRKGWGKAIVLLLTVLAIVFGVGYFYENIYLQQVRDLTLTGSEDSLTVSLRTEADEALLTVQCSDAYGNRFSAPVQNGIARFTGLVPNTAYKVEVTIAGFHQLTGETTGVYSTPVQTRIIQLNAVSGPEDGSVILSFTLDGPDSSQWIVSYETEDHTTVSIPFSGHMVTINNLTPGVEYRFRIAPQEDLYVTGVKEVSFLASKLIYAQNLQFDACTGDSICVRWEAPQDVTVKRWHVRCYNDNGYNQSVTVTDPYATFAEIDHTQEYTIEVTADGMSVSQRVHRPGNALTISNIRADYTDPNRVILSWDSCTPVGAEGWTLLFTMDGLNAPITTTSTINMAALTPLVPGAVYEVTIQSADGVAVLNGSFTCQVPEAERFSCSYEGHTVNASNMIFYMCRTPDKENWNRTDIAAADYTTAFAPGERASFLVRLTTQYGTSTDIIKALYVIRDAEDNIVSADVTSSTWAQMWNQGYCSLNLPSTPMDAGAYTAEIYFNGMLAAQVDFTVDAE